jgi:membrane protease YdiL (CAAX protease family)
VAGRPDRRAALALLLLVPAPSLGVLAGLVLLPGTPLGLALFSLSKIWLFGLPAIWTRWVAREPFSLSPAREGGFGTGIVTGLLLSAAVLGTWLLFGDRLVDPAAMGERIRSTGLDTPGRFLAGALYFVAVNAVLEEYAWRWFCLEQCRALFPASAAVALSALFFTLHHFLAVRALASTGTALVASAGVFAGAVVWGAMVVRYRSVWPGYASHALVDVCVFGIGASVALR